MMTHIQTLRFIFDALAFSENLLAEYKRYQKQDAKQLIPIEIECCMDAVNFLDSLIDLQYNFLNEEDLIKIIDRFYALKRELRNL